MQILVTIGVALLGGSLALVVTAVPIPMLGIGHPLTHVLIIGLLVAFGWRLTRPVSTVRRAATALDLVVPRDLRRWSWVPIAGVVSAVLRWFLDTGLLGGQGGIGFYATLLHQYGIVTSSGSHWLLLAAYAPVLWVIIAVDGVVYCGLIQRQVAARTSLHVGVLLQSVIFGLPHAYAGPERDIPYGIGAFLGALVYGYLYDACRNHWIAASILWAHVFAVWVIMLALGAA